jgi:tetratricopeptide (TPR) repeat protein
MRWLVALSCALSAGGAAAQDRAVFDVDAEAIEGELVRPDGAMLIARPRGPGAGLSSTALDGAIREAHARVAGGAGAADRLRLAELLIERSSRAHIARFRAEEAAYDARTRGDAGAAARAERRAADREEARRRDARAAIEALSAVGDHAAPTVRARALSLEAWQNERLADTSAALRASERLVTACPRCPEAADAHLRVAEHLFEEAKLERAVERYERAIATPGSSPELRAYARYKIGWCLYNLADFVGAWDALDAARREGERTADASGARLAREARRDQLRALASMRVGPSEAVARIRTLSSDDAERADLAHRYAELLRDEARDRDAAAFGAAWR